ncbi:MAG TPA: response regulator [Ktedonobacteraceae bacterium]|nr:response regulator [Ktedonobacteraceae bacterium]
MSKQGRILIVDNLSVWCDELVETLRRGGYYADSVSTIADALDRLQASFYHVLVADIRMKDTDQSNIDGLALLAELEKSGLSEATKVIMLSAFGTLKQMRDAFTNHRVADFLSKDDFSQEAFLKSIEQVFTRDVRINLDLEILSPTGSSSKQAILNLDMKGARIRQGDPLQDLIAEELEDLLCRLFHETKGILVRPLTAGKSGAGVLRVQPFYNNRGIGHEVIVKFGDAQKIEEERLHFKEYVEPFIGGGRSTVIRDTRRTTHLGGIIYTFLGTGSQELKDFVDFYRTASIPQIAEALNLLFRETCGTWYANRRRQLLDLKADYQRLIGYTPTELDQIRLKQFKSVRGRQKLTFTALSSQRKFTNPLLVMAETSLARTTYTCTTHGDFNPHNLLVDSTGHVWLIDFQGTGLSHILRDIAMLDSAIRFQLLSEGSASLEERYYLEDALLSDIRRFSQVEQLADTLQTENQEITKAYATVVHLRRLAYRLIAQNQQDDAQDDISEYYIALFYTALNTLQFFSLAAVQREHALLSASLLAESLELESE